MLDLQTEADWTKGPRVKAAELDKRIDSMAAEMEQAIAGMGKDAKALFPFGVQLQQELVRRLRKGGEFPIQSFADVMANVLGVAKSSPDAKDAARLIAGKICEAVALAMNQRVAGMATPVGTTLSPVQTFCAAVAVEADLIAHSLTKNANAAQRRDDEYWRVVRALQTLVRGLNGETLGRTE